MYKRQVQDRRQPSPARQQGGKPGAGDGRLLAAGRRPDDLAEQLPDRPCLLYTSDAADERSSVDLGGRRIIKKKKNIKQDSRHVIKNKKKSKIQSREA